MVRIRTCTFITGNELKFRVAAEVMNDSGIVLRQELLHTPEIQSSRVEEVAEYSAIWASRQLNQPVVVTDAGFCIEALNGFPGPFIKFINEWFSADDYLRLMQGKNNRRIVARDCLAFCQPDEKPLTFCREFRGVVATEPGRQKGTPIEQIFIPEGYSVPASEVAPDDMLAYWSSASTWHDLKKYLGG
jgi:XTP/dITP diphosphohydrolase